MSHRCVACGRDKKKENFSVPMLLMKVSLSHKSNVYVGKRASEKKKKIIEQNEKNTGARARERERRKCL